MKNGYVAITTTLLLSLVMLILAISLGSANLFTRFGAIDFNNKQFSRFLANSCLEFALLDLAQNDSYGGDETKSVDDNHTCTIMLIETSGPNKIIKTKAVVNKATTNLQLTVDADTLVAISLEELVSF